MSLNKVLFLFDTLAARGFCRVRSMVRSKNWLLQDASRQSVTDISQELAWVYSFYEGVIEMSNNFWFASLIFSLFLKVENLDFGRR